MEETLFRSNIGFVWIRSVGELNSGADYPKSGSGRMQRVIVQSRVQVLRSVGEIRRVCVFVDFLLPSQDLQEVSRQYQT